MRNGLKKFAILFMTVVSLSLTAEVGFDKQIPQVAFAAQELKDANRAMYGDIEVAESLQLGLPIKDVSRSPLVKKRGLKMAITGMKDSERKVAWYRDPDHEDWSGKFDD